MASGKKISKKIRGAKRAKRTINRIRKTQANSRKLKKEGVLNA
jgi:hypothetical protein